MGGGQYERIYHREGFFVEALFGNVGINRYWGPNAVPGESASFTTLLGGGLDTPINKHFAIRVQGDYRYENLALIQAVTNTTPYRVPGLPKEFCQLFCWPGLDSTPRFLFLHAGTQTRAKPGRE